MKNLRRALICSLLVLASAAHAEALARPPAPTRLALELGGVVVGWIQSAEGGNATSEVVTERLGPDQVSRKHLEGVKYEDITVVAGAGMSKVFWEWLESSFNGKYQRRDGAVVAVDQEDNEVSRLSFFNAPVTEIGFPALDEASKDAATLTITFAPELTRYRPRTGPGPKFKAPPKAADVRWSAGHFRLNLDGVDTSRVARVGALVVKFPRPNCPNCTTGVEADPVPAPQVPNLVIAVPETRAVPLYDWLEEFVIKGENGQDREKTGTLEYLTEDMKGVLFTLNFVGLGIFSAKPVKPEAHSDNIRRVKAEMYCEEIHFGYVAAWR